MNPISFFCECSQLILVVPYTKNGPFFSLSLSLSIAGKFVVVSLVLLLLLLLFLFCLMHRLLLAHNFFCLFYSFQLEFYRLMPVESRLPFFFSLSRWHTHSIDWYSVLYSKCSLCVVSRCPSGWLVGANFLLFSPRHSCKRFDFIQYLLIGSIYPFLSIVLVHPH